LISAWEIYANGYSWNLLNSGAITYFAANMFMANPEIVTEEGKIDPGTMLLQLGRSVGEGGIHEDIDITNYGRKPVRFNLEISIRSDFADILEVKSGHIVRRGRIATAWHEQERKLITTYRNRDFFRELIVTPQRNASPCVFANGRISLEVGIEPGRVWHTCLLYSVAAGTRRYAAPKQCIAHARSSELGKPLEQWCNTVLKIHTSNDEFQHLFGQAVEDMAGLRLPVEGTHHLEFTPAAGLPWFVALFGRDTLLAALQNTHVYPDFARGALDVLGRFQATETDDYRDADPGKILHEMRYGELAHFRLIPHTPYFGTADATPLYLILLHTAWRCTGDGQLIERHLDNAERCLDWIDRYGDRDGDGFQEYQTRSPDGYENQSWKDSGEALVYPDGSLVKGPKALCELQGYVYDAWNRMAEVYDALDKPERAHDLRKKAEQLFTRFNDAFWDEESGFYAYCLDGDKRKVLTVRQIPCIACGAGSSPRNGRSGSFPVCCSRICGAAGASGHCRRTIRPTTPCPTRTGRSGRTTTGSSRSASSNTGSPRRQRGSRKPSPRPEAISRSIKCRSSMPGSSAKTRIFRFSIQTPTSRRPGRRARYFRCSTRCSGSSRMPREASYMSTRCCRIGFPISGSPICASARGYSSCVFGAQATKPASRC
jgi:glycogen debranching enzyme